MIDVGVRRSRRRQNDDGSGGFTFNPTPLPDDSDRHAIGVPDDFTAPVPTHNDMTARGAEQWADTRPEHVTLTPRPPQFWDGDEWATRPRNEAAIRQIQDQLTAAGILTGGFIYGRWDPKTAEAWRVVLGIANSEGMSPEQAMLYLLSGEQVEYDPATGNYTRPDSAGGQRATVPELIVQITDPETLKNMFRRAVIDTAGIGWDDNRLNMAVQAFNNLERQRQEEMYNARLAAGQLGSMTDGEDPQRQEVVQMPSPEGWVDNYIRQQDPEQVAVNDSLDMVSAFMQTATGSGWGVTGGIG